MAEAKVCPKHDRGVGPCYFEPFELVDPCPKHDRKVGPCTCGRSPKKKLAWEDIDESHKRAKIFGGWLVKTYEDVFVQIEYDSRPKVGYQWQVSMTFVPDIKHEWDLYPKE